MNGSHFGARFIRMRSTVEPIFFAALLLGYALFISLRAPPPEHRVCRTKSPVAAAYSKRVFYG